MTHRQVASLFLNCLENKGNVKAWPDALSAQIPPIFISRPATFCRSCEPIPSVNHLSVKNQVCILLEKEVHFLFLQNS